MELENKTIEDYFLEINLAQNNPFYNQTDYISCYKTFKSFLTTEVHPLIASEIVRNGENILLNDHGENHVRMVIDRVSKLLRGTSLTLTPYEIFILLISIQIHDAGHIVNASRKTHASDTQPLLDKLDKNIISPQEKMLIKNIVRTHGGKEDLISTNLQQEIMISNEKIRPQLLAALLRFADELADDRTRGYKYLCEKQSIPDNSIIYHVYSLSLDSVNIDLKGHEVSLNFYIDRENLLKKYNHPNKKDGAFLIDEILERVSKTYMESIYYNRFVDQELKIFSINVSIKFLDSNTCEYFQEELKFKLEDRGFPSMHSSIFELCCNELKTDNGELKNGEYFFNQLKEKSNV